MHEGQQYLVDKGNGLVYSNNIEDPEVVGSWSEEGGVFMTPPEEEAAATEGVADGSDLAAAAAAGSGAKDEL
jgi:hypothetical protein